uniref:U1 small nuclear ribonucleoprotein 70 kDa n=1 Tax=Aceria tosichella TaxID=561515 RepID=A0A6G1SES8_9ACAR
MTQYLPPDLLRLFEPRPPLRYLPPAKPLPHERDKLSGYGLLGPKEGLPWQPPKPPKMLETKLERLERKKREKMELAAYKVEQAIALWDPFKNPEATTDAHRTLFVSRLNYDTTEAKLRQQFETYGTIKKIVMVHDKITGKPRGYAFIEYKHQRDMLEAYHTADGKRIDGRKVKVDRERGRTKDGWLPRRLGGGLGGRRERSDK